jgi:hypothetical protein
MLARFTTCLAFGLLVLPSLAMAQPIAGGARRHAPSQDERAIADDEQALGQAVVTGDSEVVERLFAADFAGIAPHGTPYDKDLVLRELRARPHATSVEVSQLTVRIYGGAAIAQGHEHEVGPAPRRAAAERVFTDTWVKIDGRWRLVAAEDMDPTCGAK